MLHKSSLAFGLMKKNVLYFNILICHKGNELIPNLDELLITKAKQMQGYNAFKHVSCVFSEQLFGEKNAINVLWGLTVSVPLAR